MTLRTRLTTPSPQPSAKAPNASPNPCVNLFRRLTRGDRAAAQFPLVSYNDQVTHVGNWFHFN